jgi:hypothetical protein
MDGRIALLVEALDQAFDRRAWHGTTLKGSLRGLAVEDALWRPSPGRHNVWELLLHAAYWKYIVRRRLTRDASLAFPRGGSNWFPAPRRADQPAWRGELALLKAQHRQLRAVIAGFPPERLAARGWRSRWTNEQHIYGIASHDLYHAGQIQLLKRLVRR